MSRAHPLVTVEPWAVSQCSGTGIVGVILSVWNPATNEKHELDKRSFATREAADDACLAAGVVMEWTPAARLAWLERNPKWKKP